MEKKLNIGLIGETAVIMELLKRGYDVVNLNIFRNNYKRADIICMDSEGGKNTMIQVKTGTTKNFIIGLVSETDGTIERLEEKIVGPWVFVYTDNKCSSMEFYILTREETIELIKTSCDWYANQWNRQLKHRQPAGIELNWLRGESSKATKNHPEYKSSLKETSKDKWYKIEDLLK